MKNMMKTLLAATVLALGLAGQSQAQSALDTLLKAFQWRSIGPEGGGMATHSPSGRDRRIPRHDRSR